MKVSGKKIDDIVLKAIPMVDIAAAQRTLEATPITQSPEVNPVDLSKKVTVGTFNGFIAIYAQGFEGSKLMAKIAGKWTSVSPLKNVAGKDYALVRRNTGKGFDVKVQVWIDGVEQDLVVSGLSVGNTANVRTR
jgi:hypothetical protein